MKEFFKQMLSGESSISSKRVMGSLCIIVILLLLMYTGFLNKDIAQTPADLANTVFWGGITLLGITVSEGFFKVKNGN